MDTDETLSYAGRTITARDLPRGEFGVYRHYEVDGAPDRFQSSDDAKAFCDGEKAKADAAAKAAADEAAKKAADEAAKSAQDAAKTTPAPAPAPASGTAPDSGAAPAPADKKG